VNDASGKLLTERVLSGLVSLLGLPIPEGLGLLISLLVMCFSSSCRVGRGVWNTNGGSTGLSTLNRALLKLSMGLRFGDRPAGPRTDW
jgi:hypothetical protein